MASLHRVIKRTSVERFSLKGPLDHILQFDSSPKAQRIIEITERLQTIIEQSAVCGISHGSRQDSFLKEQIGGLTVEVHHVLINGGKDNAGKDVDTRTPAQKKALRELLETLHAKFPRALILGHRDLSPDRKCPCFDAVTEYRDLQP